MLVYVVTIGKHKIFECKIVNISLSISLYICFGAQKNHLIEMVLLNTHNIYFASKNKNINF